MKLVKWITFICVGLFYLTSSQSQQTPITDVPAGTDTQKISEMQKFFTDSILHSTEPDFQMEGFYFPASSAGLKCIKSEERALQKISCSSPDVPDNQGAIVGQMRFEYLTTTKVKRDDFYNKSLREYGKAFRRETNDKSNYSRTDCREQLVRNSNEILLRMKYCLTKLHKHPGFYSLIAKVMTLTGQETEAAMVFSLHGFNEAAIKEIMGHVINKINYQEVE